MAPPYYKALTVTSPPTTAPDDTRESSPHRVSLRERSLVAGAFVAVAAVLLSAGGAVLWTRPLWFDEICCTLFVVEGAASPVEVVRRVAAGMDYAPPLLHLIVWSAGRIAGEVTPVVLRAVSFACVSGALLFTYFALRRRFAPSPSAAGVLAVASHALVIAHAFEGRFYGPWLLFAAAFAWVLGSDPQRRSSGRRDVGIAIAAVLLATIHWFGIVSLALMATAAALAARARGTATSLDSPDPGPPPWTTALRHVAPAALGAAALALCLPLMLSHRASALALDALWVPSLSAAQVGVIVRLFFLSTVPIAALVLLLIATLRDSPAREPDDAGDSPSPASPRGAPRRRVLGDPSLAALAALALFPVALGAISVVLQPSMLDRYAIVTVLAWAPLAAAAAATLPRAGRLAVVAFAALMTVLAARRVIAEKREFARMVALDSAAYERAATMDMPVVFASLHTAYPVAGPRRAERRARFLELPDSTISDMIPQPRLAWLRRHVTIERNIARGHARAYGFPVLVSQAQLDTARAFVLVGSDESFPRLYKRLDLFAARVFPRHRARRLTDNLALFER